ARQPPARPPRDHGLVAPDRLIPTRRAAGAPTSPPRCQPGEVSTRDNARGARRPVEEPSRMTAPDRRDVAGELLVALYELTMADAYRRKGMADRPATFTLAVRDLPGSRGYLVAAGLGDVLDWLEGLA